MCCVFFIAVDVGFGMGRQGQSLAVATFSLLRGRVYNVNGITSALVQALELILDGDFLIKQLLL